MEKKTNKSDRFQFQLYVSKNQTELNLTSDIRISFMSWRLNCEEFSGHSPYLGSLSFKLWKWKVIQMLQCHYLILSLFLPTPCLASLIAAN